MAIPLTTLHRSSRRSDFVDAVEELVDNREAEAVVVGLPLSLSGRVGPAVAAVRGDIRQLRRSLAVPIIAWDERLTTRIAENNLVSRGMRSRSRRRVVDQLAAAVILQSWLDAGMPMDDKSTAQG